MPLPRSTKRGWSDQVRTGEYAHVIAEAEESGVDRVLQAAPLSQLGALADAARYIHKNDLATRTLLAQRARFRGSLEAQNAAFFLGRLAEDASAQERAQRWYDAYLREAPRGAFVPEAYGRRLALVSKHFSTKGASRTMATDYLSRYPNGAYADLARELLSQP